MAGVYGLIQPLLFRLDPERAHALTLRALRVAGRLPSVRAWLRERHEVSDPRLRVNAFGLEFQNPVGLAAGYDKNGVAAGGLACLGFGHLEIGTLTLRPQAGNPRPRLYRVIEARGVINSLGFPNDGVDAFARGWRALDEGPVIGMNLGKGKDTPLERAGEDYTQLMQRVWPLAGYITINVSSPNTLGLRQLQARAMIEGLLGAVAAERSRLVAAGGRQRPILVKLAPDLSDAELDDALGAILATGMDGVIATNTTIGRAGIPGRYAELKGGLSGAPLRAASTAIIRKVYARSGGRLPIVGVGGIDGAQAALEKLRAGAWLVQVYTGLVYEGPGLARRINTGVLEECARVGAQGVADLRG